MPLSTSSILLILLCLGGAAGYVIASSKGARAVAAVSKITASTSFVLLALANEAASTACGRLILAALIFSWIGDVLLLSSRSAVFLAGIAAFLAAHIGFSVAFATRPISVLALAIGLGLTGLLSALILRWLWQHLSGHYRPAVQLYVAAVMTMVSLAFAASAVSLPPTVAVGAATFALSDVSVARERFVQKSTLNKVWGLPLYYIAQILFALSTR